MGNRRALHRVQADAARADRAWRSWQLVSEIWGEYLRRDGAADRRENVEELRRRCSRRFAESRWERCAG